MDSVAQRAHLIQRKADRESDGTGGGAGGAGVKWYLVDEEALAAATVG